ncbi:hypothetical protein V490_07546 [Pseudogymnoascus sp. VKM F-3557]|nr:hypothetical protein V490_07546 [Pseudogymnoascus sp. VKM F-3557]
MHHHSPGAPTYLAYLNAPSTIPVPCPIPIHPPQSIIAHASDAKPTRAPSPAARTASQRTSAQELERGRANRAQIQALSVSSVAYVSRI